MNLSQFKLLK